MKILALCTRIPAKNKNGDQVLAFNRLTFLAKNHSIELISFCKSQDSNDLLALEALGIKVSLIKWTLINFLWTALKALFDRSLPFQCAFYSSIDFKNACNKKILEFNPDLIYSVTVRPLSNIEHLTNDLLVDMVDSLGLNFSRRIASSKGLKKLFFKIETKRITLYERQIARRSRISFVVSELDRAYIGQRNVAVLPLGIDLNEFSRINISSLGPSIIFSGNMFYGPNIEAVLWFVKNCWVTIKNLNNDVQFFIAGSNPAPAIVALASDRRITVTGRVNSMAEMLNKSQISIAPMRSGSGMQFKILEAMACALPVVASRVGLGDIKAVNNDQILVRDKPEDFIASVIRLLQDKRYRTGIGQAGYLYVLENHNWATINEIFSEKCKLNAGT